MLRLLLLLAFAALLGCGGPTNAASAPAPAARVDAVPAVVQATGAPATSAEASDRCALELHEGGKWIPRATIPCPPGPVRILVAGDVGLPTQTLLATLSGARSFCAERGCDVGLLPGDLLYGDGKLAHELWPLIWDQGFARLELPFLAVLGNHEYRHEPNPDRKRAMVAATDNKLGFIHPGPSYALRLLGPDGSPRVAFAAVDTDSVSNPIPEMPGLGEAALEAACGAGVPVVWVGHHPPSSQGGHHGHEAHVETALRKRLAELTAGGCRVAFAAAGHDHDLQAYGPGCEQEGVPGVVVSGPASRGFRSPGEAHLSPCTADKDAVSSYHAGARLTGGFAWVELDPAKGSLSVQLVESVGEGKNLVLSTDSWTF